MRIANRLISAPIFLILLNLHLQAGIISSGTHSLLPNQSNQVIDIFASPTVAGEIARGLNLNFVVDDGGSIVGGVDNNSPRIVSINLKPSGGLFANIPDAQTNSLISQKLFQVTIAPTSIANRPEITTNVLLARVTLDTTGLTTGSWVLDLDGLPTKGLPSSDFAGAATTVTNGSISIVAVPEPSSLLMLVITVGIAFAFRRRRLGNAVV